ncbi:ABC transporter substrate-binding protein [Paenibacillus glycanilyticus]|uniref:Sugar ABC transporter substrate-binding protein n=1 Tax=Paenibacillus glycanilyticus TaxID=126569 RepID=A0ABQ6GD75_9BACL|nr:ABC transporter substrate-binding protein [Paenibacillus glycanilyticus]GLX68896.1 sugar ABC transporter substrate-binding protein [Paenibacillus glycanilyticus]
MKRRYASTLFLLVSASLVFTACGKSSNDPESSSSKNGNATTVSDINLTGYPIVQDKVSLKFVSPKNPLAPSFGDMTFFKNLETQSNVHIDWNNIASDGYQEKKNLLLATDDLPDAFYNAQFSDYDLIKYGSEGTIIPLENLIEKYMPNLKKLFETRPDLKAVVTAPDGHIYSLPYAEEMNLIGMPNQMFINKKWLDQLGLPVPTTLQEYHDALKAFKDNNVNGKGTVIPLSWWFQGWCGNEGDLLGMFGAPDVTTEDHRIVKDGKVQYSLALPEYKEAIAYYHEWYEEGLIDPEIASMDAEKLKAKGKTADETLGSFIWWEGPEVVGEDRMKDYVLMPPLKNNEGEVVIGKTNYSEYSRDSFVITKANKQPEITARWADQLYDPKTAIQAHWGPIGEVYKEENGKLVNLPVPAGTTAGEYRIKVAPGGPTVITNDEFGTLVDMEPRAKQRLDELKQYYFPYQVKENYPFVFFSAEDLDKINQIETQLKEYTKQMKAKWLMDGGVDKEWDGYLKKLDQIGLQELLQIYQKGYDDFKKNNT